MRIVKPSILLAGTLGLAAFSFGEYEPIALIKDPVFREKVDLHAKQDPYITSCLAKLPPEGRIVPSHFVAEEVCGGQTRSSAAKYYVGNSEGRLRLMAKLEFKYKGLPANKPAVLARLKKAKECMADFFGRHGILLNVLTRVDPRSNDDNAQEIGLWDFFDRPNNLNWAMLQTAGRGKLTEAQTCSVTIHEFGHLLGMDDNYPDADCPERTYIGPADDVMNDQWPGPDKTRFYPRELKVFLKPLCGP